MEIVAVTQTTRLTERPTKVTGDKIASSSFDFTSGIICHLIKTFLFLCFCIVCPKGLQSNLLGWSSAEMNCGSSLVNEPAYIKSIWLKQKSK